MPTHASSELMNGPLRKPWTQEEFFSWAERQEPRYEFDGTQPVSMTGGTINHDRITRKLNRSLDTRLGTGPCEPLGPNAGVETAGKAVRYPDALVTCSKVEGEGYVVPGVVVVFEVISPSSSRIDRIVKLREYAAIPSVRRYVIIESTTIGLTVFERSGPDEMWRAAPLTKDDILRMPEIGIEIPVAEFYEGMAFPDDEVASA